MAPPRARVRNGRLEADESVVLTEGAEYVLTPVDAANDLEDPERAELEAELLAGLEDIEAGRTVDAKEVIAELRARRQ